MFGFCIMSTEAIIERCFLATFNFRRFISSCGDFLKLMSKTRESRCYQQRGGNCNQSGINFACLTRTRLAYSLCF